MRTLGGRTRGVPLRPPPRAYVRGDVAQLGERLVRNEEVGGSNPLVSTISPTPGLRRPKCREAREGPSGSGGDGRTCLGVLGEGRSPEQGSAWSDSGLSPPAPRQVPPEPPS